MLNLVFPLDFERHSEFRMLCDALRIRLARAGQADPLRLVAREAIFLYARLFVELGYLAQVTNRPGFLSCEGVTLFESSLEPSYGEDCSPVKILVESRVLVPLSDGSGQFFCERFARLNAHLSGDYKSGVDRGAANSAVVRAQKQLAKEAMQQAMLLPLEFYKKRDGTTMNDVESRQAILLVKNLDRCLKLPPRQTRQFTEGLVMDAGEVAAKFKDEALMQFYFWLRNNRENPALPKTTEKILAEFDKFFAAADPADESKEQTMTAT